MQIHAICLHRPWHLSQFSVNTTEASGRRGNFKCKFRRHLIWHIDRSGAVCTEQQPHGCWPAAIGIRTTVLLTTTGSDSWTVYSFVQNTDCLASYIARTANTATDQTKDTAFCCRYVQAQQICMLFAVRVFRLGPAICVHSISSVTFGEIFGARSQCRKCVNTRVV